MSDDDYAIETADAGASATIPMEAGAIKKGGYVLDSRVLLFYLCGIVLLLRIARKPSTERV